jgi:signal transduction histidine kinase
MSAPSGLNWQQAEESAAGVPLDILPFPAAIVDRTGLLLAANPGWQLAYGTAPGDSWLSWCEEVHNAAPGMTAALSSGVQAVLGGSPVPFVQDCNTCKRRHRITVAPCPHGALILHQVFAPAAALEDPTRVRANRMETMGRLAAGVTHDFANLLTLISGYSEIILSRTSSADPLRPDLEEIRKAAQRGSRLTHQLLGFSRGESAAPRAVDLNAIIADVERLLRPIIGEYVDFAVALAPQRCIVLADPGQMEQVLLNLILNARDAIPAGGWIRVETAFRDLDESGARHHNVTPGPYVLLSISDNGHGVDSASMRHIFEPF